MWAINAKELLDVFAVQFTALFLKEVILGLCRRWKFNSARLLCMYVFLAAFEALFVLDDIDQLPSPAVAPMLLVLSNMHALFMYRLTWGSPTNDKKAGSVLRVHDCDTVMRVLNAVVYWILVVVLCILLQGYRFGMVKGYKIPARSLYELFAPVTVILGIVSPLLGCLRSFPSCYCESSRRIGLIILDIVFGEAMVGGYYALAYVCEDRPATGAEEIVIVLIVAGVLFVLMCIYAYIVFFVDYSEPTNAGLLVHATDSMKTTTDRVDSKTLELESDDDDGSRDSQNEKQAEAKTPPKKTPETSLTALPPPVKAASGSVPALAAPPVVAAGPAKNDSLPFASLVTSSSSSSSSSAVSASAEVDAILNEPDTDPDDSTSVVTALAAVAKYPLSSSS